MKKILTIIIIFLEIFIMMKSKEVIKEFTVTINLCLYALLPTMFFQILFSNILINNNLKQIVPDKLSKLLNISKDDLIIFLLSVFSGYPNNIRLLKDSKNEYFNYVTNYINPLFLVGTVGYVYLHNQKIVIIIYISHIISNIIMFFILRKKYLYSNYNTLSNNTYYDSLNNTIKSISIIFSNLLLISLFIALLKISLPFNNIVNSLIIGLVEFSRGIYEISGLNINIYLKGLLILIIISFGSISIHFQSISFNPKIKYIKFLIYRILNVFISVFIYLILLMNKL